MRFVANLRQETIDAFGAHDIQPAAYLLSSHRVSPVNLRSAEVVRQQNIQLFADNGTKPMIDETIRQFRQQAREIRDQVVEIRRELDRVPRGSDVPESLRSRASELADTVVQHTVELSNGVDTGELLDAQLSMDPTDLIAKEDFGTACLIALDLDRETTGWRISRFATRNSRSLRLWGEIKSDPRCANVRVHAVLSAMDYNTARTAGRLAGRAGVEHAALGLAGIMLDPSAVDFHVFGHATLTLDRPAPRRYVRLAQILRGIADGFREVGRRLSTFHCLGLGAPPLLPIPPLALDESTSVTTDATSPIHDAARDRVLYDLSLNGHRANGRQIVERIVKGGDWPFLSPFTQAFRSQFGHEPGKARSFWEARGRPPITIDMLRTPSELTEALPLFSEAVEHIRLEASRARIAHNHWVLGELCAQFDGESPRHEAASSALQQLIDSSTSSTTTRGIEAAREVLTREAER